MPDSTGAYYPWELYSHPYVNQDIILNDVFLSGGNSLNAYINFDQILNSVYDPSLGALKINIANAHTLPFLNLSGGTVTGTTNFTGQIQSGGTDLYDIFLTTHDGNDITRVQPGTNITTGGTPNNPIVNVVDSPSFTSVSANTFILLEQILKL